MSDETMSLTRATAASAPAPRGMFDFTNAKDAWAMAAQFSASTLVPKHFQNQQSNCFVALTVASQLRENPLTVMQNMYVVHGTPAFSAKYLIARANTSGVFRGRIRFEEIGTPGSPDFAVKASAVLADDEPGSEPVSFTASMKMAQDEGWAKNPKYRTLPTLMLSYRAASFLVRLYAPDVTLGYHTTEELEDVHGTQQTQAPAPQPTERAVASRKDLDAASMGLTMDAEVMDEEAEPAPSFLANPGEGE